MTKRLAAALLFALGSTAYAQTPPTNVFGIDFTANNSLGTASSGHARLKFNSSTGQVELSVSTGSYAKLLAGTVAVANGGTGLTSAGGVANRVLLTTDGSTYSVSTVPNTALSNSSITINTAAPMGGGGVVALGGTLNLTCSTCLDTLQTAYTNGGAGGGVINLNSTGGGLVLRDNATPLGGNLFAVTSSDGLTTYFAVTASSANSSVLTLGNGASAAVSAAGFGNMIYNDTTKTMRVSMDGSAYDSLALLTTAQELTNKTLTAQAVKNGLTASGSAANDFSGSTGTFKTSTGAVTVGPGAVGVSGQATFSGGIAASGSNANDFSGGTGNFLTSSGSNTLSGNTTLADTKTFTGSFNNSGASSNVIFTLQNTTASTNVVEQYGPMSCNLGTTWNTSAGGSSQTTGWCWESEGFSTSSARSSMAWYHNSNGVRTVTGGWRNATGGGIQFVALDPTPVAASLTLSNGGGNSLCYNSNCLTQNSVQGTYSGSVTDGAGAWSLTVNSVNTMSTSGAAVLRVVSGSNTATYVNAYSGQANIACPIAVDIVADTGGITAGRVVVWTSATKAQDAAASANLGTIAGVALTTAASTATARVCRVGRVLANADAGIVAGNLVGTSSGTAGNVAASTPALGQVVGRATEATGATTAGKAAIDVLLN